MSDHSTRLTEPSAELPQRPADQKPTSPSAPALRTPNQRPSSHTTSKPIAPSSPKAEPPTVPRPCPSAQHELDILIRARYPIVYVVTWEEERVRALAARDRRRSPKELV